MSRGPDSLARTRETAPAFSGRLAAVSLFDAIQFLLLNRKTGTLTVRSGAAVAYLTFAEGQIMTALDEALREGEPVVERAVQWNEGTFEFAAGPVPPDRKILTSTDNVLLEAARRIDEARAGGLAGDGGSIEAELVEKQTRGSALSEAFRAAVAGGATGTRLRGWRAAVVRELARPGAWRLLLGPGAHATIVGLDGVRSLPDASAPEVAAWMDELAPRHRDSAAPRRDPDPPRAFALPDGGLLWAQRHAGPEGDWLSVSLASRRLPEWRELGLEESLLDTLESPTRECLRLVSVHPWGTPCGDWPGMAALAAWLSRRSARRPEVAWVVETLPRYDWSALPGRVRSVPPSRLRRPGAVVALARASGASLVALAEPGEPLIADGRQLSREGVRVVLLSASPADAPEPPTAAPPPSGATPGDAPPGESGTIWEVHGGFPPDYVPLTARLLPGP